MKLIILSLSWLLFVGVTAGAAVPNSITYQGTLKDGATAANGEYTMTFRITNGTGQQQYWSGAQQTVSVRRGLFTATLSPENVDWQNITPFVEVSVNGQVLLPRQALTTTPYAYISNAVVDGAIGRASLATDVGTALIPSGMVAMFAGVCPPTWSHFSQMDDLFPMGSATPNLRGGTETHAHRLATGPAVGGARDAQTVGFQSGSNGLGAFSGGGSGVITPVTALTDERNHLPPYLTLNFCRKD
jgi:hypothetical protein